MPGSQKLSIYQWHHSCYHNASFIVHGAPSNASASAGTGTATGATLYVPNTGTADIAGHYSFNCDLGSAVPSVQLISATTSSLTLKSQLPASSPDYDKVLGNGSLQVKGAVTIDGMDSLDMHGKLDNANPQFTDGSYVKASDIGLQV